MPDESNNQGKPRAESAQQTAVAEVIKRDYEIGYAKPPVATRFKKGKSGNPKGSKKTSPIEDVRIVIENILMEPIDLREGGKVRTVSKLEAIMQAQRINAELHPEQRGAVDERESARNLERDPESGIYRPK